MKYMKKIMASWEIKHGQIMFSGNEYIDAKDMLKDFAGRSFSLEALNGQYKNVNILDYPIKRNLRISCAKFFKQLPQDMEIFINILGIINNMEDL